MFMLPVSMFGSSGASAPFVANAVNMAVASYLRSTIASPITSTKGMIIFWRKRVDSTGLYFLFTTGSVGVQINTTPTGVMEITTVGGDGLKTNSVNVDSGSYKQIVLSWDYPNRATQLLIDGVLDTSPGFTSNPSGSLTISDYAVFNAYPPLYLSYTSQTEYAQMYANFTDSLDFTNPANILKVRGANGKPISFGDDGSLPTGTIPHFYSKDPFTTITTNSGSGGALTKVGTITAASTSPSD